MQYQFLMAFTEEYLVRYRICEQSQSPGASIGGSPVAPCRTIAIEIAKHKDNDFTRRCDFDNNSPGLSHQHCLP